MQAQNALFRMRSLIDQQVQLLKVGQHNSPTFKNLDRELDLTFGEKERAFGALHSHTAEHGC